MRFFHGFLRKRRKEMKIFITADIEGITGASHWDETDKKNADYAEYREQMTAEVAAACEGALKAGATEIWVKDAHWTGRNILAGKLPKEVQLVREWSGHPFQMMQELDNTFFAAMAIGYHSRAASGTSPLAHTMTGNITYIKINGQYAAEFMISAYTAGLVEVPVVFISGDAGVCQEAQALIPGIHSVAVMKGMGSSTISIHPHLAVEKIRSGVEAALKGDAAKCRLQMPDWFSVEVRYRNHASAYHASFFPGVSLKEPHIVQFETGGYFEVLRFFAFCLD
jgi:D-amino peptidase